MTKLVYVAQLAVPSTAKKNSPMAELFDVGACLRAQPQVEVLWFPREGADSFDGQVLGTYLSGCKERQRKWEGDQRCLQEKGEKKGARERANTASIMEGTSKPQPDQGTAHAVVLTLMLSCTARISVYPVHCIPP